MKAARRSIGRLFTAAVVVAALAHVAAASWGARAQVSEVPLKEARNFRLQSVGGEWVELSSYVGKKAVLLDFFTTWCGACVEDLPKVKALAERYGSQGLEVIGINLQETEFRLEPFLARLGVAFPVLLDRRGEVANRFQISSIPTLVLVDRGGRVRYQGHRIPSGIETVL